MAEISVPQVRTLNEAEMKQREAAMAAFRFHWKSDGHVQMPDGMGEMMKGAADEGSSSEDTSDEAYAARHKPKEDEERQRFLGIPGESILHLLHLDPVVLVPCFCIYFHLIMSRLLAVKECKGSTELDRLL